MASKGITREELAGIRQRHTLLLGCVERGNQEMGEAISGQLLAEDVPAMLDALERLVWLLDNDKLSSYRAHVHVENALEGR